ncbi:hypothetical protein A9Q84_05845 [Halobacteriovorax marinus]|uniref:Lipoprotein n=1 Tax=Halobacteriovorax marinus TaxID=97084 RepID=A0A1Y5FGX1_9BACT|nr:hypothetical protein A9Q84_05845 [Halobacteriovorax marinus]
MKIKFLNLCIILLISSCSKVETINLKKHKYNQNPGRIVWMQIAGLSEEHLALLRFSRPAVELGSAFEESHCFGKMWNFNLYDLRPDSSRGFLSQIYGTKNITDQCRDYENVPMWSFFKKLGYKVGVLESGAKDNQSIVKAWKCADDNTQLDKITTLWKMSDSSNKNAKRFHFQEKIPFVEGNIYYDKSCKGGICYASLFNNATKIYENTKSSAIRSMLVIRDFNLEEAVDRKDIESLQNQLREIEKTYNYFVAESKRDPNLLVVMSGSGTRNIELPSGGRQWEEFDKKGRFVLYKKNSLMSPVFARGPRSENFCGLYEESSIFKRFLWSSKDSNSPLDLLGLQ